MKVGEKRERATGRGEGINIGDEEFRDLFLSFFFGRVEGREGTVGFV